jgi:TolC family type I secretion outer membrane protein
MALSIGPALLGGCALANSGHLPEDAPASSSSAYVPRAPLPELVAVRDGQDVSPHGQALTLAQCIEIALTQNPETRGSWQRARSAAAAVGQARSAYLPSADFTAGANRSDPVSSYSRQETGPGNTFDVGFNARYLLFDGGERAAGIKDAEAELLAANFRHNETLMDVALRTEVAYYQLLADKELQRVAEQTLRQTQYHVDVARARHENGLVARSDVLKAETEEADADLQLVRARSQVRISRGSLANAMGLKPSESFEVAELPENSRQREPADINLLMTEAAKRPELRAALARVEADRAKLNTAKARYWPQVTLNTDYGWRDRTFVLTRAEWSLGVGISWPLFDGFNREYAVRRARSDLAEAKAEYDRILRSVELEVWTAYEELLESKQAIDAALALVASAEESARVTEGEYKNGTASIVDVIDAQTARTAANVRLVQARLDWYTAMANLERAIGRTSAGA